QWEQRLTFEELGGAVVPEAADDPDFEPPDGEEVASAPGTGLAAPAITPAIHTAGSSAQADLDRCCGLLVSFAYPDRIAMRRPDGRYLLRNGRGAQLLIKDSLGSEAFLAIAEVDDEGTEGRILLAASLEEEELYRHHAADITEERSAEWDVVSGTVRARIRRTFGAIVLREQPDPAPSPEQITRALLDAVAAKGVAILPWTEKARKLQERLMFLHRISNNDWPDVSDETLGTTAETWLAPYLSGVRKRADLQALSLYNILENLLTWSQQQELNAEAPTHLHVPSGSKIQVHYDGPQAPYAAVRLQEVFGMIETPRIGFGRIPITLHLLSPASRPVQVTSDLRSFWQTTYFEVKKDLKGRYPKHYWPDDPLQATATRRVRPDGQR
ncbi:MAG: ATP-dependent helicase HrpB, partial [Paenibacillaceae bacterium]|nr:ATP-dependent helicase HrpB [Paenibacillaceae bacterium]